MTRSCTLCSGTLLAAWASLFADRAIAQNMPDADPATIQATDDLFTMMFAPSMHLQAGTVRQVQVTADGPIRTISFEFEGEQRTLLVAAHSMREEGCTFMIQDEKGELIEIEPPPLTTFRGVVSGKPGSQVAVSIREGGVFATVDEGNGLRYAVQPVAPWLPEFAPDEHVVYHAQDVVPSGHTCGTQDHHRVFQGDPAAIIEKAQEEGQIAGNTQGRAQIAFDADFEYFQLNGSSVAETIADIEMIMNNVGLMYQNQLSICYASTGFIVRTAEQDPYSSSAENTLLCQFRSTWNTSVFIPRDVAHLFTGKEIIGSTIGLAWVGVMCNLSGNDSTCSPASGNLAYGFSQSQFSTNLTSRIQVTAHELGHNWNACHCNQSSCTGGDPEPDCGIMNSSVDGSTTFGSFEVSQITAYRTALNLIGDCLSDCLDPIYVWGAWSGIENGSSSLPYNTVAEGANNAMVNGDVSIYGGSYPVSITINRALTLKKWAGAPAVTIGE